MAIFFPSIWPAAAFEMRQEKTWLQLQDSSMMIKEKQQEFAAKKKERNQMEGAAAKSHFPYFGVEKIMSFIMIEPPLQLSISFFN